MAARQTGLSIAPWKQIARVFFPFWHQWRCTVSCSQALVLCRQHPAEPWCGSLVPDTSIGAGWEVNHRSSSVGWLKELVAEQLKDCLEELLEERITSSQRQQRAVSTWLGAGKITGELSWRSKSVWGWGGDSLVKQSLSKSCQINSHGEIPFVLLCRSSQVG